MKPWQVHEAMSLPFPDDTDENAGTDGSPVSREPRSVTPQSVVATPTTVHGRAWRGC